MAPQSISHEIKKVPPKNCLTKTFFLEIVHTHCCSSEIFAPNLKASQLTLKNTLKYVFRLLSYHVFTRCIKSGFGQSECFRSQFSCREALELTAL